MLFSHPQDLRRSLFVLSQKAQLIFLILHRTTEFENLDVVNITISYVDDWGRIVGVKLFGFLLKLLVFDFELVVHRSNQRFNLLAFVLVLLLKVFGVGCDQIVQDRLAITRDGAVVDQVIKNDFFFVLRDLKVINDFADDVVVWSVRKRFEFFQSIVEDAFFDDVRLTDQLVMANRHIAGTRQDSRLVNVLKDHHWIFRLNSNASLRTIHVGTLGVI